jgi:hypothetical protein
VWANPKAVELINRQYSLFSSGVQGNAVTVQQSHDAEEFDFS